MDEVGRPSEVQSPPQELVGFSTNAEWRDLVSRTAALIESLDDLAEDDRRAVFEALAAIDLIHREALHRLVRLFKDGVLEQVITDPAIETLMGMYDLLPPDTSGGASGETFGVAPAAEPPARKVWDILPLAMEPAASATPTDPPHWSAAPLERPPCNGETLICQMEEGRFVVAAADDRHFAFAADCPAHGATMTEGRLDGFSWICPHGLGCVYDIRDGSRLGGGEALDCRPVKADERRVLIGFGLPFSPKLPAY